MGELKCFYIKSVASMRIDIYFIENKIDILVCI